MSQGEDGRAEREADQLVTNDFGERVWLKPLFNEVGERIGITDCCFADSPCERHQHSSTEEAVERHKAVFLDWPNTSNFLARQVVDDLVRAGLPAAHYQHVVEKTLLQWPLTGRDKKDGE